MRLAAVTLSVNNPDEPVRLTKEQLFRGLLAKARDPTYVKGLLWQLTAITDSV